MNTANGRKVAAIILNYQSSQDVKKCVSYLKRQTYQNLLIIIVDNGSPSEEERERIADICSEEHTIFIQNDKNAGFNAGNNLGLRRASRENVSWSLILNPDVEIRDSSYIETLLKELSNYPAAVVAGSDVRMPDDERQNPLREVSYREELLWPFETVKQRLGIWKGYLQEDVTGYCYKVSGCCFLINMKFAEEIGYFDESVFMYCEEPILAKTVEKYGHKEVYIKEATAYHQHIPSQKGSNRNRMLKLIESRKYYLINYSGYRGAALKLLIWSKKIQEFIWKKRN